MLNAEVFSYAFLIGFVPVFVWLCFWLYEDSKHPEPSKLILRAFLGGMACVLLVIPLQKVAADYMTVGFFLILTWAALEEVLKFLVAWVLVLRNSAVDEPLDPPVYLITVALGFAALENTLFLITPLANGQFEHGLITGNLRFIGATLIHTLSSAVIGAALAFSFYRENYEKVVYALFGVILAILLHTFFNFSIIQTGVDWLLLVFASVWVGIMFLLLMLERIKLIRRPAWWEKMFIRK